MSKFVDEAMELAGYTVAAAAREPFMPGGYNTAVDKLRTHLAAREAVTAALVEVAELVVSWLDEEPGAHKLCDKAIAALELAKGQS